MFRDFIHLTVNGKAYRLKGKNAFLPLSDLLRYELGLTGTKVVCAEGDCGACTIMFSRLVDGKESASDFVSFKSCISASILLDGCHLVTVEGLKEGNQLTEVQQSMIRNFGGQCGFCTPGFVMSITNMYENKSKPSVQNIKNYLTGNLCRCTGYLPIIEAAKDVDVKKLKPVSELYDFPQLSESMRRDLTSPIRIQWEGKEFFAPTTMAMAAQYRADNPDAKIFSGATDIGVQVNKGKDPGSRLMSLHLLKDLYRIEQQDEWIQVGARVTLHQVEKFVQKAAPGFARFLSVFASPQIKNTATLVGNIANGSPIADTTPFLLTADGEVVLCGVKGRRTVALSHFFLDYKKFDLRPDEIIEAIRFRGVNDQSEKYGLYKVSQRRDLDISCVNASFVMKVDKKKVQWVKMAYGGVGPITLRLFDLEDQLRGQEVSTQFVAQTKSAIATAIRPISDLRGSEDFRRMMAQDLFEKFMGENYSEFL